LINTGVVNVNEMEEDDIYNEFKGFDLLQKKLFAACTEKWIESIIYQIRSKEIDE
jgi:hypothetical protein